MVRLLTILIPLTMITACTHDDAGSFAGFDRRAQRGERMKIVFFGASLTWGANASDPMTTSYRAHVARWLEDRYPRTQFQCHDAAIGGTGSQLGAFRLDRDVLRHEPDLVFVDFTANDDIRTADPETMASYEAILRRLIGRGVPVVINIFPFCGDAAQGTVDDMAGREATIAIANAYHCPIADAVTLTQARLRTGDVEIDNIWPWDGAHPADPGYRLFAEAATTALGRGIDNDMVCRIPTTVQYDDTYMNVRRVRLSALPTLPDGWTVTTPSRTAAWYDGLMTRWLDDVTQAAAGDAPPEPLNLKFRGSMLMLFGEETLTSGQYRVAVDGQPVMPKPDQPLFNASAERFGGNRQHAVVLATGLDAEKSHTLTIEPVLTSGQVLRIESICVAGGDQPNVWQD
jgi:lysophospholipase L1-like esterase